ncbi:MAG: Bug family tripartite tricarboxylate transporter substrate binding protein [Pigmentiphaga sp.]
MLYATMGRQAPLRQGVRLGLGILALLFTLAGPATAQDRYPTQPIKLLLPFGVGGLADISSRLVAQALGEKIGQQVIIENRPGAGGIVAANATLAAPADGHTLTLFANGTTISQTLFKLPYSLVDDFSPISTMAYFDLVLFTDPKGPFRTLDDVVEESRKRQLVFGTINPGSTQNLSAELFRSMTGIDAMIVPFKATPDVLAALVRGDVDVMFESYAALKGAVAGGQAHPLAATGSTRSPWLPEVPTVKESGIADYEVTGWNALFAPAGTPPERVQWLNEALNEVLRQPELRERFLEMGTEARGSTPDEMAAILRRDIDKWAGVIQQAGLKTGQ